MTQPPTPPSSFSDDHPRPRPVPAPMDEFDPLADDDEELSEELTPEDEMWLAITDYVSGHATAEEAAAVEARMAEDPAYAKLVGEIRTIWALPFDRILAGRPKAPPPLEEGLSPFLQYPPEPEPGPDWRTPLLWGAAGFIGALVIGLLVIRLLGY